jgi:hypothetical protein
VATGLSEAEPFWTDFLRSLTRRGLRGVKHFIRNALAHANHREHRLALALPPGSVAAYIQEAYIQGISTRSVDELVKAMGMSGVSKSQVSRLCEEIDERVQAFLSRPIEGDWPYLWIDATYVKTRQAGKVVSRRAARLQEPREGAATTELGYLQVHRAGAGFQYPVAVAVAAVDPFLAALAVGCPAQRLDIHLHQPLQGKLQRLFDEVCIRPLLGEVGKCHKWCRSSRFLRFG